MYTAEYAARRRRNDDLTAVSGATTDTRTERLVFHYCGDEAGSITRIKGWFTGELLAVFSFLVSCWARVGCWLRKTRPSGRPIWLPGDEASTFHLNSASGGGDRQCCKPQALGGGQRRGKETRLRPAALAARGQQGSSEQRRSG